MWHSATTHGPRICSPRGTPGTSNAYKRRTGTMHCCCGPSVSSSDPSTQLQPPHPYPLRLTYAQPHPHLLAMRHARHLERIRAANGHHAVLLDAVPRQQLPQLRLDLVAPSVQVPQQRALLRGVGGVGGGGSGKRGDLAVPVFKHVLVRNHEQVALQAAHDCAAGHVLYRARAPGGGGSRRGRRGGGAAGGAWFVRGLGGDFAEKIDLARTGLGVLPGVEEEEGQVAVGVEGQALLR